MPRHPYDEPRKLSTRETAFWVFAAAIALVVLLSGCVTETITETVYLDDQIHRGAVGDCFPGGDVAEGQQIYADNCTQCHSKTGVDLVFARVDSDSVVGRRALDDLDFDTTLVSHVVAYIESLDAPERVAHRGAGVDEPGVGVISNAAFEGDFDFKLDTYSPVDWENEDPNDVEIPTGLIPMSDEGASVEWTPEGFLQQDVLTAVHAGNTVQSLQDDYRQTPNETNLRRYVQGIMSVSEGIYNCRTDGGGGTTFSSRDCLISRNHAVSEILYHRLLYGLDFEAMHPVLKNAIWDSGFLGRSLATQPGCVRGDDVNPAGLSCDEARHLWVGWQYTGFLTHMPRSSGPEYLIFGLGPDNMDLPAVGAYVAISTAARWDNTKGRFPHVILPQAVRWGANAERMVMFIDRYLDVLEAKTWNPLGAFECNNIANVPGIFDTSGSQQKYPDRTPAQVAAVQARVDEYLNGRCS